MATLISAYNPSYSENASILTGNPNRVIVEIEDSIDKGFWEDILKEQCPSKDFHFNPYHTVLDDDDTGNRIKGKTRILKIADQMNDWHIGCIDSESSHQFFLLFLRQLESAYKLHRISPSFQGM